MKKGIIAAAAAVLLMAAGAQAAPNEKWTKTDIVLEAAFLGTLGADWSQTLHISRNPGYHEESNPILGEHPNQNRINLYFAACAAGHVWIADELSGWKRTAWQAFWTAAEIWTVQYNRKHSERTQNGQAMAGIGIVLHF